MAVRGFEISGYLHGSMLFKKHLDKQKRHIYKLMSVLKQILVPKSKPVFQKFHPLLTEP